MTQSQLWIQAASSSALFFAFPYPFFLILARFILESSLLFIKGTTLMVGHFIHLLEIL